MAKVSRISGRRSHEVSNALRSGLITVYFTRVRVLPGCAFGFQQNLPRRVPTQEISDTTQLGLDCQQFSKWNTDATDWTDVHRFFLF